MVFKVKGCLCFSLRTGSNIIALIGIILCSVVVFFINHRNKTYKTVPNIAIYLPNLYILVSLLLLIGINKPYHRLMVPWMLLQAVVTFLFTYIVLTFRIMQFALLVFILAYSLLIVWSFFMKVKEDAEKNEADASIQFYSEPREMNHVFIMQVPISAFKKSLPIDDLPPSYDSVVGTSAPSPSALS